MYAAVPIQEHLSRGLEAGRYDVDSSVSFEESIEWTQEVFARATEPEYVKGIVRINDG